MLRDRGGFFSARTRSAQLGTAEWEEVAVALGIDVDHSLGGAGDALFGSKGELAVAIGRVMSTDRFVMRYRIHYPAFDFGLQMLGRDKEAVFEARNLPIVVTGRDSLDAVAVTRSDDRESLDHWLMPDKANVLRDVFARYRPLEVSSMAIAFESPYQDTIDEVVRSGRDLLSCAAAIRVMPAPVERPAPPPPKLDLGASFARQAPEPRRDAFDFVEEHPNDSGGGDEAVLGRIITAMFSSSSDAELDDLVGSRVRWTGSLRAIRSYETDLDLGSRPGVKATVTVREVEDDLHVTSYVDAVVGLPPGSRDGIRRGDPVQVEGTIIRIDTTIKTIVLADGHLQPSI
jgi:hypothetical protein